MYMSQEMPNLRHFLARFLPDDNNFGKYYLKHIDLNVVRAFNSIQDVYVSRGTGTR